MFPTFVSPWLLFGLLSVGVLGVVYMLRIRSRRMVVSSLLLWTDEQNTETGGRVWQKLRTPLTFFVELLVLVLLVMAAADPLLPRDGTLPIVVVLDNSYSMQAGGPTDEGETSRTSRDLAREKLAEILKDEPLCAQVILAGRHPALLNERFNSSESLDRLDPYWRCLDPTADLDSAITLARQVGGLGARVLVITDQPQPEGKSAEEDTETDTEKKPVENYKPISREQVRWISVGRELPNLAIVTAVRSDTANPKEPGHAIVEVANLSTERTISELVVQQGERHIPQPLDIKPGEIHRFSIPITDRRAELELTLPSDSLELDNRAVLLPESVSKLRVQLSIKDKELREALRRVLLATGRVDLIDTVPQIRFSDKRLKPRRRCWDVFFLTAKDATPIAGPFVLDKTNELLEGITLTDVVMSQSKTLPMPGWPLVASDRATLASLDVLPDERERLFLQYEQKKTTLLDSPDFPILVWNLLRWREGGLLERCRSNIRLGEAVRLRLKKSREQIEHRTPSGETLPLNMHGNASIFSCDTPGRHAIVIDKGDEDEHRLELSTNVLFRDESNLRDHGSGEWGQWKLTNETRRDYFSVIVPLLLAALVLWVLHGRMIRAKE